mgnify:CR=1 FL=1
MNIIVFGATGKTGLAFCEAALEKDHNITAFLRSPEKLGIERANLSVIIGDVYNSEEVAAAVAGNDAVVCALGSGQSLAKTDIRSAGTSNIITAMKSTNVKRLFVVSAMGVGESWDDLSLINKLFFAVLLKSSREDHEAQEAAVKASDLDWTIIRPSGLTDEPATGDYMTGERIKAITSKIARADIAHLILKELEANQLAGKAVTITN